MGKVEAMNKMSEVQCTERMITAAAILSYVSAESLTCDMWQVVIIDDHVTVF